MGKKDETRRKWKAMGDRGGGGERQIGLTRLSLACKALSAFGQHVTIPR